MIAHEDTDGPNGQMQNGHVVSRSLLEAFLRAYLLGVKTGTAVVAIQFSPCLQALLCSSGSGSSRLMVRAFVDPARQDQVY